MRIAFLGLGNMGGGMAGRLLAAGHSLAVFNRTATRAAPFEKLGARIADSPRSAALQADIIIGMSADDESSRAMWLGTDGALAADNLPDALEATTRPREMPAPNPAPATDRASPRCRDPPGRAGGHAADRLLLLPEVPQAGADGLLQVR